MDNSAQKHSQDTGRMVDAVIRLNAARRASLLYPPGHVSIEVSIDVAFTAISGLLELHAPLTLRASKKALMIAGLRLPQDHAACQEFARVLYDREIAAMVFQKEVTKKDLGLFIDLLNRSTVPLSEEEKEKAKREIPHIIIRVFDYRNLKLTVETAVLPGDQNLIEDDLVFVQHSGPPAVPRPPGSSEAPSDRFVGEDISGLSEVVGQYRRELDSAVNSYEKELKYHFHSDLPQDKEQPILERIEMLNMFSEKVGPSLSKQLQAFDFNRLATNEKFVELDQILGNENTAFIFDALNNANNSDQEISPTLIGLVRKILSALSEESTTAAPSPIDELGDMLKDHPLEQLFKREDYERYIIPEYDALLKRLARDGGAHRPLPEEASSRSYLQTFEAPFLESKVKEASLRLLESNLLDDGLYRNIAGFLTQLALQWISAEGAFDLVLRLVQSFQDHMIEKSMEIRASAEEFLKQLQSPEMISKTLDFIVQAEDRPDPKAVEFLLEQGPGVVPLTLNAFFTAPDPNQLRFFQIILDHFPEETLTQALSKIWDPDPQTVKRVMMVLGRMGDRHCAPSLEPLLSHPDWGVQQEAMNTLLQFEHPSAIRKVCSMISSSDRQISDFAVQSAGRFMLKACVPALTASLRMGCFTQNAIRRNEAVIRSLGQIADPTALPFMKRIAKRKLTLHREALAKLKLTLFTSLENYALHQIGDLLKIGRNSKDTRIRNLAMQLSMPGGMEKDPRWEEDEDRSSP
jgi:hypothetical protein